MVQNCHFSTHPDETGLRDQETLYVAPCSKGFKGSFMPTTLDYKLWSYPALSLPEKTAESFQLNRHTTSLLENRNQNIIQLSK